MPLPDRLSALLPRWLSWPLSALSTAAAVTGAGLLLVATALGSVAGALWSATSLVLAAVLWHLADYAGDDT